MVKDIEGLFVPTGQTRWGDSLWYYIVGADCGVAGRKVQLYDYPYSEWQVIPAAEFAALMKKQGLYKRVGIYSFERADNPALPLIRAAHIDPRWAGEEVYRLRKQIEAIRQGEP